MHCTLRWPLSIPVRSHTWSHTNRRTDGHTRRALGTNRDIWPARRRRRRFPSDQTHPRRSCSLVSQPLMPPLLLSETACWRRRRRCVPGEHNWPANSAAAVALCAAAAAAGQVRPRRRTGARRACSFISLGSCRHCCRLMIMNFRRPSRGPAWLQPR